MAAHRINCAEIELAIDSPDLAKQLLDRVSGLREGRIAPLIESVCSELSGPGQYDRLDSIEIHLGSIALDNFDDDFLGKLEDALREELKKQLGRQLLGGRRENSSRQLLECFARTGNAPWWADCHEPGLISRHIGNLLSMGPVVWFELLREVSDDRPALARLARHCDDALLQTMLSHIGDDTDLFREVFEIEQVLDRANGAREACPAPTHTVRSAMLGVLVRVQDLDAEGFIRSLLVELVKRLGSRCLALLGEEEQSRMTRRLRCLVTSVVSPVKRETVEPGIRQARRASQALEQSPPESWEGSVCAPIGRVGPAPERPQGVSDARQIPRLDGLSASIVSAEEQLCTGGVIRQVVNGPATTLAEARVSSAIASTAGSLQRPHKGSAIGSSSVEASFNPDGRQRSCALSNSQLPIASSGSTSQELSFEWDSTGRAGPVRAAAHDSHRVARRRAVAHLDQLYVDDAGLVILWPLLERFFQRTGLFDEDGKFLDEPARMQGVALLSYLALQDPDPPEFRLPLAKLLCGMAPEDPYSLERPLTEAQLAECVHLLAAVITHATIPGESGPQGFRTMFLQRSGALGIRDGIWLLRIERAAHDVVLERFPWSWHWVGLSWMSSLLQVEW